jgi:tetratricopeptide (TPR) repeat protein
MCKNIVTAVVMVFALMLFSPVHGQGPVDSKSNGQPTSGDVDEQAVADLARANELFTQEGKEQEALSLALQLYQGFRENEDYNNLVDCAFLIGEASYYLGEWQQASFYMQQAWDFGTRYFEDQMSSYPLKVIGECQFELGQQDDALRTFQERVQWLRKHEDVSELAGALFDVGGMLINTGREEDGLLALNEARSVNNERAAAMSKPDSGATDEERDANVVDHAEITYHLAIGNYRLGRYQQARDFLEEARAFFISIQQGGRYNVEDRLVAVLDDLVLTCTELGDDDAAADYAHERDTYNK